MSKKELNLLKENSFMKYNIISLIEELSKFREYKDIKDYLIQVIDNKDEEQAKDKFEYLRELFNEDNKTKRESDSNRR